ncbi:acetyl-CoA carboxylase biotin carboxyl carrier protein [Neorhizobium huautlense]|uniref:Biotin carboxyl carrier protein of acetyl-CoA carboxylase n=1 Tax=Neorhizobium huautlense TaxID=67774 RepID=A0ABT9PQY2_9HYPH|nr:biotin/lipoyl-containing protein [Neorhizobium huautlense]MDP9836284.1 acetyl-CoA carboxylase biotin carboxyl carrier protein [Neorhizobium huautlense]
MDLAKIETLIDFVGRSNISQLIVTEKDTTVRILRDSVNDAHLSTRKDVDAPVPDAEASTGGSVKGLVVEAPIFGVLHLAPAPGDPPFVAIGDEIVEGQTLFIIEAMKVFNKIVAPRAGKITRLTDVNGAEVEVGDMLAEIA